MKTRFSMNRGLSTAILMTLGLVLTAPVASRSQDVREAEALSASFRNAARKVLPAVVSVRPLGGGRLPGRPFPLPIPNIDVEIFPNTSPAPFRGPIGTGGSGVVIDAEKGFVLTNDHVVNGATRVAVVLPNGRERIASQIRRDPKSDLALLVVDPRELSQAELGDSSALEVGDWILAIGQPFGLSGTVTAGIVSGKGRGIGLSMYEDLIQTDAAINPGNSGGPLVNLQGQVVGISTALKTERGGFEGVGFAIPIVRARRVANDLAQFGSVRRAYLGVNIGPIDPMNAERIEQPGAVVINDVRPGSPADQAGLRRGDIVVALGGSAVQGTTALQSAIEFASIGEPLNLTVDRQGQRVELTVRPEAQPEAFGLPEPRVSPAEPPRPREPERRDGVEPTAKTAESSYFAALGLRLSDLNPRLARKHRIDDGRSGVVIVGVDPDGPADHGGLEIGMLITDAANRRVTSLADFRAAVADRPEDRDLLLRILRGSKPEFRIVPDRSETTKPSELTPPSERTDPKPAKEE